MRSWRSRIVGHDTVDPLDLTANPKNHRTHEHERLKKAKTGVSYLDLVYRVFLSSLFQLTLHSDYPRMK